MSVNTSRGKDRGRSGRDRRAIATVIQVKTNVLCTVAAVEQIIFSVRESVELLNNKQT